MSCSKLIACTVCLLGVTLPVASLAQESTDTTPIQGGPKFTTFILTDQGDSSFEGIQRFTTGLKERGYYGQVGLTFILHADKATLDLPGQKAFWQQALAEGCEIGVERPGMRDAIAKWLDISPESITFWGTDLFGDAEPETQTQSATLGYEACANVCPEGDSLMEFWDIPHNWEGAPMFPYWAQWDAEKPLSTDRTNRELDKKSASLELQWATRTLYHNWDRAPCPECWHFGEPLKKNQWRVGQLVKRGDISFWTRQLDDLEANLAAGRTPFLYLSNASEGNIFTPSGPWSPMLDNDEALECALDLVGEFLKRGWILATVHEFATWYAAQWPCPAAPSMVYLVNDVLDGRTDRDGKPLTGHGPLLHAETEYFQITDHELRMAPEFISAYALRTPNLLRGGYTFADPAKWNAPESGRAHYASTTGNALFWSPTAPLADPEGVPYFAPNKPAEARDRCFTLYLGDDWAQYQFAPGHITDVGREGDLVRWSKRQAEPISGTDIILTYHNELDGPLHRVKVEVQGADAVGQPVRLRLCPYFHQGWDYVPDSVPPELAGVGQERSIFASAEGKEFAWSESNVEQRSERWLLEQEGDKPASFSLFNRNPGLGKSWDDNPDFNRGFTVELGTASAMLELLDEPGPRRYVTAIVDFGPHQAGQSYEFSFRYFKGAPD